MTRLYEHRAEVWGHLEPLAKDLAWVFDKIEADSEAFGYDSLLYYVATGRYKLQELEREVRNNLGASEVRWERREK